MLHKFIKQLIKYDKKYYFKSQCMLFVLLVLNFSLYAAEITLDQNQTQIFISPIQSITLPEYILSEKMRRVILSQVKLKISEMQKGYVFSGHKQLGHKQLGHKQLGMNNVPVLDQGRHGTCVTFAVSAAMDTVIAKGDYISQLCLLQLGTYLVSQGQSITGWNGSYADLALERLKKYGVISQLYQNQYGCGDVVQYPLKAPAPMNGMSIEQYTAHSESLVSHKIYFNRILNEERLLKDTNNGSVGVIKNAINSGHRVAFSVLLPRVDLGVAGAVGSFHKELDTWVISHDIFEELTYEHIFPGHEMVITGYDDAAIAIDQQGVQHRGLLTIRNSWGHLIGDHGNFYMSYDYFNALVVDAHEIF